MGREESALLHSRLPTVFLVIPNYVYSSDFLRTDFIHALAGKFRIVVLLPMAADSYPRSPDIAYAPWRLQFPEFWTFWGKTIRVPLIRMFDHEPLIQRNYELSFGHWKRKLLRRLAFLFPKRFWNPDFISRLELRFLKSSPEFNRLVEEHRPALILTPTPGFTEIDAEAILLARRVGIPSAAIDFSWDNLTSNCKHLRKPDYLVCWTERMRRQAIEIHGFSPERVFVSGVMRFDHYFRQNSGELTRGEFLRSKELDPAAKTILITTVTRGNYRDEPAIIRKLLEERERGVFGGRVNLFIRLHPKESFSTDFDEFRGLPGVHVERAGKERPTISGGRIELDAEDLVNLKDTLRHSDVVVNYASTITLEACVFDKPVVNIGFPPYFTNAYSFTHYKPVVELGAVRIAKSFEDLVSETKAYLGDPSRDRDARAQAVREFIGFTDGKSYERIVRLIDGVVESLK
ncbi:MAG: hypothetical protein A3B37_01780 [Candidatus Sungbacteria bacterium RIFCSPLOWO2_01_FULL_59_16]|uniref:UDP-N-acetylglucosamine 2-epimerase domain-containing protein n=1 Tax=Candidatus Sungbacteria bacterium RIFCSPLOWO2_01_FULL_59_16 TaxID=1802280 RepID=A0A1G2LCQ0_9BACT|nr:MAG: hypothetical protein A3B37_01780 [Candidatus Sungbacteria bacterium RIFCSPLOWO2_01_FULL_59_16]